jgi:hypothetical protein
VDLSRLEEVAVAGAFDEDATSAHKSTLFPTRIHVKLGSACSRTSASQVRAFWKPVFMLR